MFGIEGFYNNHINEITDKVKDIQSKIDSFVTREADVKEGIIQKYGGSPTLTVTETKTLDWLPPGTTTLTLYPKEDHLEELVIELALYSTVLNFITSAKKVMDDNPDELLAVVPTVMILNCDDGSVGSATEGQIGGGVFKQCVCFVRNCFHATNNRVSPQDPSKRMDTIRNGLVQMHSQGTLETGFGERLTYTIQRIPPKLKHVATNFESYCTALFAGLLTENGTTHSNHVVESYIAYLIDHFLILTKLGNTKKAIHLAGSFATVLLVNNQSETYKFHIEIIKNDRGKYTAIYSLQDKDTLPLFVGEAKSLEQVRSVMRALDSQTKVTILDTSYKIMQAPVTGYKDRQFDGTFSFETKLKEILGTTGLTFTEKLKLSTGFTSIVEDPKIIDKIDMNNLNEKIKLLQKSVITPRTNQPESQITATETLINLVSVK
jgi:hypothetical protein